MTPIHCPRFHEPVVSKEICNYCGTTMVLKFENTVQKGHDVHSCTQCVLKEA